MTGSFFSKMHSMHIFFLDIEHKIKSESLYLLFVYSLRSLTESITCPEKREEPYYGIYLFEMYRHIFPSYHVDSIKTVLYV